MKRAPWLYTLMQIALWSIHGVLISYAQRYLAGMGMRDSAIGLLLGGATAAGFVLQPLLAAVCDRTHLTVRVTLLTGGGLMLLCCAALLPAAKSLTLTAAFYAVACCMAQTVPSFVNALGMAAERKGMRLNFGPAADSGLTGRKIIVDTYGGYAAHGGGAFSGKDPTKVDRSAAYMARYVAKNLVAAGLAAKCQIELAYAIGVAHPVSVLVDTFGTGRLSDARLSELVSECFDLRPAAIIRSLDLRRPIYQQVAAYGHFGRADLDLPWEKTDAVERILARA